MFRIISKNIKHNLTSIHALSTLYQVTNRVIATSFPSSGVWSLYRNPIEKVAAFLDTKHRDRYIELE